MKIYVTEIKQFKINKQIINRLIKINKRLMGSPFYVVNHVYKKDQK